MNSRKRSGSGIFLMEMIMVCGFFLVCAVVCVRVFVRADSMSRLAREKNQAVLAAQSLGELWKAGDLQSGERICFDEDWKRLEDGEEGWYAAVLSVESEPAKTGAGSLEILSVSIGRGDEHPRVREMGTDGEPLVLTSLQIRNFTGRGLKSDG